jgi:hypothetical protein
MRLTEKVDEDFLARKYLQMDLWNCFLHRENDLEGRSVEPCRPTSASAVSPMFNGFTWLQEC